MVSDSLHPSSKISLGIPLFRNDRRTLLSIASAISQSQFVERVIISDDGNNESIGKLFCGLDSRVLYKKNSPSLGMWSNFVQSYKLSSSRYFGWLGDDDFISPSFATNIARAIENHPACVAWMGLPNSHTTEWGTKTGGLMLPIQSINPYSRVLDIFAQGKYGAFFYSVFDTQKVSIYPLERLLSWPYYQFSYDYIWMINLAIQGNIFQDSSLLYFYDQTNWSDPSMNNPSKPKLEDRLSVPLTYIAGTLLSIRCYLSRPTIFIDEANSYVSKPRFSSWIRIITMMVSKYLIRSLNDNEISCINSSNMTLKELLLFSAQLADEDHSNSTRAVDFWNEIISEIDQEKHLRIILSKPYKDFNSRIWINYPDAQLNLKKVRNLFQTAIKSRFSYGLWTE